MSDSETQNDVPARRGVFVTWVLQIVGAMVLLGVGGGIAYRLITSKPTPGGITTEAVPRLVRVMEARRGPHRCSTSAFGTSTASQEWAAISETSGDAVLVDANFEVGEILLKDTLLVQIDPEGLSFGPASIRSGGLGT